MKKQNSINDVYNDVKEDLRYLKVLENRCLSFNHPDDDKEVKAIQSQIGFLSAKYLRFLDELDDDSKIESDVLFFSGIYAEYHKKLLKISKRVVKVAEKEKKRQEMFEITCYIL